MKDSNGDPLDGLTISANRSLNGGAFASATGTVTEISDGAYQFAASAADMNGDRVVHKFTASGAKTLMRHFICTGALD